jgi:hypothetical protein
MISSIQLLLEVPAYTLYSSSIWWLSTLCHGRFMAVYECSFGSYGSIICCSLLSEWVMVSMFVFRVSILSTISSRILNMWPCLNLSLSFYNVSYF